jgi:hypothetical protein
LKKNPSKDTENLFESTLVKRKKYEENVKVETSRQDNLNMGDLLYIRINTAILNQLNPP